MSAQTDKQRINSQPPYTPEDDHRQEKWKTRPSTEVDGDKGENADRAAQRTVEENTPPKGDKSRG